MANSKRMWISSARCDEVCNRRYPQELYRWRHCNTTIDIKRRTFVAGAIVAVTAGLTGLADAAILRVGPVRTVNQFQSALQLVRTRALAALVDIRADWCDFCRTIDWMFTVEPAIVEALSMIALIQVDVTATGAASKALLRHLNAEGPPTLFVVDTRTEREHPRTRSVGAFSAADLLARLRPFTVGNAR